MFAADQTPGALTSTDRKPATLFARVWGRGHIHGAAGGDRPHREGLRQTTREAKAPRRPRAERQADRPRPCLRWRRAGARSQLRADVQGDRPRCNRSAHPPVGSLGRRGESGGVCRHVRRLRHRRSSPTAIWLRRPRRVAGLLRGVHAQRRVRSQAERAARGRQ